MRPPSQEPHEVGVPSGNGARLAGKQRSRLSRARRRWRIAVSVGLIAMLMTGAGAVAYLVARPWATRLQVDVENELQTGANELQLGTDAVREANGTHNLSLLDQAEVHFTKSRAAFGAASRRVSGEWLLTGAQRLPLVGPSYLAPRLAVVTHVSAMGVALADAGTDTAKLDRQLLSPANQALSGGQRLISVLAASGPTLGVIKSHLDRADNAASLVDPNLLPGAQRPSFLKARSQIQSGLAGLAEFQRLSPVLLEILGANGPRTYLMEQVDPAELRGAGGFIGSFSLLSADHGNLTLGKSGDVFSIDFPYPVPGGPRYLAPPNSSKQFTQHGWVFGDSNFSPDFPTSARAGEQLFQNETGMKVDGVISLDPTAVATLLGVSGPIAIPEYQTTVMAATFAEDVFQREEKVANIVPGKKQFFPLVADRLIAKISDLPSEGWPSLLKALNTSVQSRHLQVFFNNNPAETEMGRINWAGSILQPSSDRELMLEVESNFGGNKANHFIERSYDLTLVSLNGKLTHHLVISLKNGTPDGYLGGRHYTAYLRYYYQASATDAVTRNLTADGYPSDEKPNGMKLADGWLNIQITNLRLGFATSQVTIDYTTDLGDLNSGHEIYWQKQAGTQSDKIHVSFQSGSQTYSLNSDLSQDRLLTLTPGGLAVVAAGVAGAQLPILGT